MNSLRLHVSWRPMTLARASAKLGYSTIRLKNGIARRLRSQVSGKLVVSVCVKRYAIANLRRIGAQRAHMLPIKRLVIGACAMPWVLITLTGSRCQQEVRNKCACAPVGITTSGSQFWKDICRACRGERCRSYWLLMVHCASVSA